MKNKKSLILLLICLAVLIGAYFAVRLISDKVISDTPTIESDKSVVLTDVFNENINEVRLINKYGDITYLKDSGNIWRIRGNENIDITQSVVKRIATQAGNIVATDKIEDTCDNLAKYELDKPRYEVSFKDIDGNETKFYMGMQNQVTQEFYIYVEGIDGIYTISHRYAVAFDVDPDKLQVFYDIASTTEAEYLKEMSIEYGDNSWHIIKLDEVSKYDVSGVRAWYMIDLYEHEVAVDTSYLKDIQNAFLELTLYECKTIEATDEELEAAGIAEGNCKGSLYYYFVEASANQEITEDTVTGEQKLWLGNKTEDGKYYYARPDGAKGIYTVFADTIDALLSNTAEDLIQKYISVINISTVNSYKVKMGDISFECEVDSVIENDVPEYSHYYNGKKLAKEFASSFYTSLIGVYAERSLMKTEKPSGKPLLEITFYRNTDILPVYEIAFYEYSVSYYKVAVNGEISYLANARDYKSLVESITNFIQNITYAE